MAMLPAGQSRPSKRLLFGGEARPIPIRQVSAQFCPVPKLPERFDDRGMGRWQDFSEVLLAREIQSESKPFYRWAKLRIYTRLVSPGVHAIPTVARQQRSVQSVKAIWWTTIVKAQSLVTEPGGDSVSPQQSREEVALRITIPRARQQDL